MAKYKVSMELLRREYLDNKKSFTQIAKELGVSDGLLIYHARKYGLPIRSRTEAQRVSREQGRAINPHEGKSLTPEHRAAIAKTLHEKYQRLSDEEKEAYSKKVKAVSRRDPEKLKRFTEAGQKALKTVAKKGSNLEHFFMEELILLGYSPQHGKKWAIQSEDMHIDIMLESEKIAIEVDGPQHLRVIYSQEDYDRKKEKDQRKNGLLLQEGYTVIRLGVERARSLAAKQNFLAELLEAIKEAKKNPNTVIYIGAYRNTP